jgi:hypothetical protein
MRRENQQAAFVQGIEQALRSGVVGTRRAERRGDGTLQFRRDPIARDARNGRGRFGVVVGIAGVVGVVGVAGVGRRRRRRASRCRSGAERFSDGRGERSEERRVERVLHTV